MSSTSPSSASCGVVRGSFSIAFARAASLRVDESRAAAAWCSDRVDRAADDRGGLRIEQSADARHAVGLRDEVQEAPLAALLFAQGDARFIQFVASRAGARGEPFEGHLTGFAHERSGGVGQLLGSDVLSGLSEADADGLGCGNREFARADGRGDAREPRRFGRLRERERVRRKVSRGAARVCCVTIVPTRTRDRASTWLTPVTCWMSTVGRACAAALGESAVAELAARAVLHLGGEDRGRRVEQAALLGHAALRRDERVIGERARGRTRIDEERNGSARLPRARLRPRSERRRWSCEQGYGHSKVCTR